MARLMLEMALDFARSKKDKGKHEQVSRLINGQWYLIKRGPTYANSYKVLEASTEEIAYLERIQEKEPPIPPAPSPPESPRPHR